MATFQTNRSRVIQLDAKHEGGQVVVTPADEDRFTLRVGEVIRACQQAAYDEQARQRFELLLKRLQSWVWTRADLQDAFLTTRDGGLLFLVVKRAPAYDEAFEDSLSELDIELAEDPDIRFSVDVLALPPASEEAMQSFISSEFLLRFKLRGEGG